VPDQNPVRGSSCSQPFVLSGWLSDARSAAGSVVYGGRNFSLEASVNFFSHLEPHPLRHREVAMAVARMIVAVELSPGNVAIAVSMKLGLARRRDVMGSQIFKE
jgi:hypothetical protein